MFTINIYLRLALSALLIVGGVVLSIVIYFWYGFPFWLAGLILFAGYVMFGTVQSSAELMQKMQFEEAEKRLGMTLSPKLLIGPSRAYYYIIKGTVALNLKKTDEAEEWLKKANELPLSSDDERAMILLQLANISGTKSKWNNAQLLFRSAKKLKITDPNLREQMKQFEKALTNRGQMKHLRQGGGKGMGAMQGGKRRRPKMK